jgi:succinoglycan biosynthesis transport protein ExoP
MAQEREYEWADELDLLDMLHILRNRWWVIAVCFVLAVAISAVVTYNFIVPVYKAETTLFAGKEPNRIASLDLSDLNLDQRLYPATRLP